MNSVFELRIDGVLVDVATDIAFRNYPFTDDRPLLLGTMTGFAEPGGDSYYYDFFNGHIDDLSIWSNILTETQIQTFMSTQLEANELGLVGYWNFNEGNGTTITDQTSNGNDGNIHGTNWSSSIPPTLGEISDNDLLIETHELLFTEYSLIESSQLEVGKSITLKFLGHTMCIRAVLDMMLLGNICMKLTHQA